MGVGENSRHLDRYKITTTRKLLNRLGVYGSAVKRIYTTIDTTKITVYPNEPVADAIRISSMERLVQLTFELLFYPRLMYINPHQVENAYHTLAFNSYTIVYNKQINNFSLPINKYSTITMPVIKRENFKKFVLALLESRFDEANSYITILYDEQLATSLEFVEPLDRFLTVLFNKVFDDGYSITVMNNLDSIMFKQPNSTVKSIKNIQKLIRHKIMSSLNIFLNSNNLFQLNHA